MRILAIAAVLALAGTATSAEAQVHVRGYTTRDGTYVAPHYRSSPDGTTLNNWSTRGNVNPYTGQVGTRNPYSQPSTSNPYSGGLYTPRSSYSLPNYGTNSDESSDPQ
jgi:hypothetical protein